MIEFLFLFYNFYQLLAFRMASRDRREKESSKNAGGGTKPTARNITFFIPGVGIDREVISTDICRYLGNDALVKPAKHNVGHGRTSAMISLDLTDDDLGRGWFHDHRVPVLNHGECTRCLHWCHVNIDDGYLGTTSRH